MTPCGGWLVALAAIIAAGCGRWHFDARPDANPIPGDAGAGPTPLVWLKLDELSGMTLADASGHGHAAQCSAGACPALGVEGALGKAAQFDGQDQYAMISYASDLDLPTLSVSLWAKQLAAPSTYGMLAARQYGTGVDDLWLLYYDSTTAHDYAWDVHTATNGNVSCDGGPSTAELGIWQHLVGTYDGATTRLYKNGVLVDQQPATGPLVTDTTGIFIGAANNGNPMVSEFANAVIDDVRIYPGALSERDVATLYLDGNLAAYWPLDETAGTVFADASGNGNLASCTSCPTLGGGGRRGTAAHFANAEVIVGPNIGYGPGNQITVAAWVRYSKAQCPDECYVVATSQYNTATPYNLEVTAAGNAELYVSDVNNKAISSGVDVGDGAWHQLVGTFDGNAIALYVDGVVRGNGTGAPATITDPVAIGSSQAAPTYRPFTGDIDDVRIYRRALTARDAANLYAEYP